MEEGREWGERVSGRLLGKERKKNITQHIHKAVKGRVDLPGMSSNDEAARCAQQRAAMLKVRRDQGSVTRRRKKGEGLQSSDALDTGAPGAKVNSQVRIRLCAGAEADVALFNRHSRTSLGTYEANVLPG